MFSRFLDTLSLYFSIGRRARVCCIWLCRHAVVYWSIYRVFYRQTFSRFNVSSSRCCSNVQSSVSPRRSIGYAYSRHCLLSAYSPAAPVYVNVFANLDFGPYAVSLTRVAVVSPTPAATALVERAAVLLFPYCYLFPSSRRSISCSQPRTLTYLRDCSSSDVRDSSSSDNHLFIASLNVRSLGNKVDNLLEVHRERLIDVLCLVETRTLSANSAFVVCVIMVSNWPIDEISIAVLNYRRLDGVQLAHNYKNIYFRPDYLKCYWKFGRKNLFARNCIFQKNS